MIPFATKQNGAINGPVLYWACKLGRDVLKSDPETTQRRDMTVKDSNGTELKDGDNVTLIKDLKVKGANATLKRGTMIKGIRLTDDEDEIDCRHEKIKGLVLRTEFVKKA